MRRLWPTLAPPDDATDLDDEALLDAYAPDRTRPCVRVNFVTSLDGAVEVTGHSRGLSSEADQRVFSMLRTLADAIMVGAGTLRHERYGPVRLAEAPQAWRRQQGLAEQPTLVIVSASLDFDAGHRVFTEAPVRPVVLTHAGAPSDRRAAIEPLADVVTCGESVVDLAAGLADLRRRGLGQVLCEGGPQLFGALLAADLVDELCLTVSPLLVGAGPGRIVAGAGADAGRAEPLPMRLVHVIAAGDMLLTRYARAS